MTYQPLALQEGDYVIPDVEDVPDSVWTPARIIHIYENGNVWARSDDGSVIHRAPLSQFKLAP